MPRNARRGGHRAPRAGEVPAVGGVRLGSRYRVIEKLGEGTFGQVFRVLDRLLGEELALNRFTPAVATVDVREMLREEFLVPLGLTQVEAARRLGMSVNRLNELVLGKRGITADTALRLARRFKMTPQFWMHLQADWDLHQAMKKTSAA